MRYAAVLVLLVLSPIALGDEARQPAGDAELKRWLTNMVAYHRFTIPEIEVATGMSKSDIQAALVRFHIKPGSIPARAADDPLVVLPYPGGRHPRIGFLEGAIDPQRETKISVFAPWKDNDGEGTGYVVADVPEAIWSNLGLTYLAHTHVPTVWTQQGAELEQLEWQHGENGLLEFERRLPNGIRFGTQVTPRSDGVKMTMWLTNGTSETLSDLRVQNCVMLKGLSGFTEQTNDNKVFAAPYAACRSEDGRRWVITAWEPCHRAWGNVRCPCLHSDPKFPDCPPGETQTLRGWLSFYEGDDVQAEFRRLDGLGWKLP